MGFMYCIATPLMTMYQFYSGLYSSDLSFSKDARPIMITVTILLILQAAFHLVFFFR